MPCSLYRQTTGSDNTEGDLLLDARQFKIAVPDSTIYFLPVNTRLLFGRTEQCISLITSVDRNQRTLYSGRQLLIHFRDFLLR